MSGAEGGGTGVLAAIVESKRREIEALQHRPCRTRIKEGPRGNVASSLRRAPGQPLRLLAEHKRKSPSAGVLSTAQSAAQRALRYAEGGAAMVSILCDAPFFGGSWDDLVDVRQALVAAGHAIPLLAKEFVIHERQLQEATACGADAVLLIARILDRERLATLLSRASSLGLESVVEVVTEEELGWAIEAGATIVGVNARDLDTLAMDPARASRVLGAMSSIAISLYLSGLKGPEDVRQIAATRTHAALVGETLMREDDPVALLTELVKAARI